MAAPAERADPHINLLLRAVDGQQQNLNALVHAIESRPLLRHFYRIIVNLPERIASDWSCIGLGFLA